MPVRVGRKSTGGRAIKSFDYGKERKSGTGDPGGTEHKTSGKPGTSRYITTKNKKNTPERLELKKFNPILKKVTVHKEIK